MESAQKSQSKFIRLSVVVASLSSQIALKNCLESVSANDLKQVEIIVADCSLENALPEWIENYSKARFLRFPVNTSLPVLLAAGIKLTSGEIVAITDSSCVVADNWISSILQAHRTEQFPVIGGAMDMLDESASFTDWAAFFCDYGQFTRPSKRGTSDAVSGNNFSFKRRALETGAEFVEREFWKTHWCRKLQSEGNELFSEPLISVYCAKNYKLIPFLAERFYKGRAFAEMRGRQFGTIRRAVFAAGSILLPLLFLFRTISPVAGKRRFIRKPLPALPIIVLAIFFWSIGETTGYLAKTRGKRF